MKNIFLTNWNYINRLNYRVFNKMGYNNEDRLEKKSIEKIIAKMTLKEKIGQMVMVGFDGGEINPSITKMIEKYKVGGIIYFVRNLFNPGQAANLSAKLQELSHQSTGIPLFLSTDEEGGIVTRVKGMTHFPGLMSLGAADSPRLTKNVAQAKGEQLKYLGINFNLSPVLDINNNPQNPIIGVRSFGSKPESVAKHGKYYIKGIQNENVITCGKHFPGHGNTATDSHLNLPVIDHKLDYLKKMELIPFKKAINNGIDSIMIAHIAFPTLTGKADLPATLSSEIITELLRNDLGFQGIIITDCMEMQGISKTFGTAEGAIQTVKAGSDQVLISHTPYKQIEALEKLLEAVKNGEIKEDRINNSLKRILKLKQNKISAQKKPVYKKYKFDTYLNKGQDVSEKVSRQAVTVYSDPEKNIPLKPENYKKLLLLDLSKNVTSPVENVGENKGWDNKVFFKKKLKNSGYTVEEVVQKDLENPEDRKIKTNSSVIIVLLKNFSLNSTEQKVINKLNKSSQPILAVCQGNPYSAVKIKKTTIIFIYDNSPTHIKPLVEIIEGKQKPLGKLP